MLREQVMLRIRKQQTPVGLVTLILIGGAEGLTLGLQVQVTEGLTYDKSFSHVTMKVRGHNINMTLPGASLCHFKGRISFHFGLVQGTLIKLHCVKNRNADTNKLCKRNLPLTSRPY